jgi:hypothetical protein
MTLNLLAPISPGHNGRHRQGDRPSAVPTPPFHIGVMNLELNREEVHKSLWVFRRSFRDARARIVSEQRLANLRKQVQLVLNDLPRLTAEIASDDVAASHFIDRLRVATDNAAGCALLADARLSAPVAAVVRTMLESLVTTHWASLNNANAEEIQTAAQFEFMRLMRNLVTKGRGIIQNRITGQNETQRILDHPLIKTAKRPPRINRMAKESGLDKLYDLSYGFMSLLAHGTDTTSLGQQQSGLLSASVEAARAFLEAIYLIVVNRVREHRSTEVTEIEAILGVISFR